MAPDSFLEVLKPISIEELISEGYRTHFRYSWLALCDDLNTPNAIGEFFVGIHALETNNISTESIRFEVCCALSILRALGLDITASVAAKADVPADIAALAEKRWAAKAAKDFAAADTLRKELTAAGWSMLDRKDGYSLELLKK